MYAVDKTVVEFHSLSRRLSRIRRITSVQDVGEQELASILYNSKLRREEKEFSFTSSLIFTLWSLSHASLISRVYVRHVTKATTEAIHTYIVGLIGIAICLWLLILVYLSRF